MSKLFEVLSAVCWLALLVNQFVPLWEDNTLALASAVLFALWALLYEIRERKQ